MPERITETLKIELPLYNSMQYVEAPEEYNGKGKSVFIAGTITGAPDWQHTMAGLLEGEDVAVLNPRRKFHTSSHLEEEQIRWEHRHLRKADAISFWFAKETLNPIVLYELGAWSMTEKPLFIGIEPGYSRRADVEIQTKLARPDVKIVYDLEALVKLIKEWLSA